MAFNCSRAAGASTRCRASWAAARRLASGLRSPWATAAAICPIDASFSDCTSCARDWRSCSVIRPKDHAIVRSEEHTSELQSQSNLVCRLLLEKKKKKTTCRNKLRRLNVLGGTVALDNF